MRTVIIYIAILLAVTSCKKNVLPIPEVLTKYHLPTPKKYVAGDSIVLAFTGQQHPNIKLVVNSAWGTTVLSALESNSLKFNLPQAFAQKSGLLDWSLVWNEKVLKTGSLFIGPAEESTAMMETYLGPPSIFADDKDQSMVVALPQDRFGNPLKNSSKVIFKQQFKERRTKTEVTVKNGIAFTYLHPGSRIGERFIAVQKEEQVSKEMSLRLLPATALNFTMDTTLEHHYADGNQLVKFSTSIVKDFNGNVIADGTVVNFSIKTSKNASLYIVGLSLNGIAKASILHPEQAESWKATAYIAGSAHSNTLNLEFKSVLSDFDLKLKDKNKRVEVGPLKSYMGQLIPDGLTIDLKVFDSTNNIIHKAQTTSFQGMGKFNLPKSVSTTFHKIEISTGGTSKEITKP